MKILLIASALVYAVGLWFYADARRADYLQKARAAERPSARASDGRLAFGRCPDRADCLPDPAGFVELAGKRAAAGRPFTWLSAERVPLPSYRSRIPCENNVDGCRPLREGDSEARFDMVSACNPRILACN